VKFLIVSPFFPPQNAVASLRVHAFARAWAEAGEDVTVLTTDKRPDQRGMPLACEGFGVVEIPCRAPAAIEWLRLRRDAPAPTEAPPAARRGVLLMTPLRRLRARSGVYSAVRMPDLTDHWVRPAHAWASRHGPWDAVVSSSGPYTAHLVALRLRRAGSARLWVADFRDLWTDNHLSPGLFPFTLREASLERACLRAADLVTTVSEELAETLRRKTRAPVEIIYNGCDANDFALLPAEGAFPADGLRRLVYTGTLYEEGQDPSPLFEALADHGRRDDSPARRIRFAIAGGSGPKWRALAMAHGIDRLIEDRGPVDRETALRMQRDADALVILDWKPPHTGVLTAKLFEYLAVPTYPPILAIGGTRETRMAEIIRESRRGVHLAADVPAIREFLGRLTRRDAGLRQPGNTDVIIAFSRRRQSQRLLDLVRGLPA
jgi:hypothetical protein